MTEAKYFVDPCWCFENYDEAAEEISRLHKRCDELEDNMDIKRCLYLANGEWHQAIILAEDGDTKWIKFNIYQHGPYYVTTDNLNHIRMC